MRPNNDAIQLMRALYRSGNFGYYWRSDNKQTTWFECDNPAQLPTSENLYFGVHPIIKRKTGRGTKENVQLINCLYAEFDAKDFENDKDKALNHITALEIYPSALIDSGGGYHAYWFLTEPVHLDDDNREEIDALQKAWVKTVGGDPNASDLARVLRVPGTYNAKYDPKRLVKVEWLEPQITYTLHELENLTKPDIKPEKPAPKPSSTFSAGNWSESLEFWTTKALEQARPGNRDNTGFWLATQLRDAGLTIDQATSSSYPERVPQTKDKYTRKDYERTVKSAYSGQPREPAQSTSSTRSRHIDNNEVPGMEIKQAVEKTIPKKQTELVEFAPGKKETTDLGNAERMVILNGADIHWSNELKNWLVWNGTRWVEDTTGEVKRRAQMVAKSILIEAYNEQEKSESKKLTQWAHSSQNKSKLDAMIDITKSQPGITIPLTHFDTNPYKLNFLNGTLDLETGKLHSHNPLELMSKQIQLNYDSKAKCPLWMEFLNEIMDNDEELINYLQRCIGYSLTGDTSEQCLFVAHGKGANGKTVFTKTILGALGEDYTKTARAEAILTRDRAGSGATPDLARLRGARLVAINEIPSFGRLNEALVKEMTGNDDITARFLFSEEFTFSPAFKLWISTNYKPVIRDAGDAIWRRMRLIPFTVTIPKDKQDAKLIQKLQNEWQGIITWAVNGCLEWQKNGLQTPEKVESATKEYRSEEDILQPFFDDKCILKPELKTIASDIYKAYKQWCEENQEKATNNTRFGRMLSERGYEKVRVSAGNMWLGIGLKGSQNV